MSLERDLLKDDIAFLRSLAGDGIGMKRDAAMLLAVGLVFGVLDFLYWLVFSGIVEGPPALKNGLAIGGVAVFVAALALVMRIPQPTNAAGRAAGTALGGVGLALIAAELALFAGGRALHLPLLPLWTLPIVLFTLYGAAWGVAFVVKRRAWFGAIAGGCYLAAFISGSVMGSPAEWLVSSLGLLALVAAPGAVMLRRCRE
jgi:hypothetical protein